MNKETKQESKVQAWGTAYASLIRTFQKYILGIKSVEIYIRLKICYGKRININPINSIRNKLVVVLKNKADISIGQFLMVDGPLYIKAEYNGKISIGNRVFFNHNCSITAINSVVIGDGCNIANNVVIVDHDHKIGRHGVESGFDSAPVEIQDNVWIGANATILKGVTIGKNAIVAAGAVVNKDVPSGVVAGGVPAQIIKNINGEMTDA